MDIFVDPPTAQTRGTLWLIDIPEKREAFDFFPGQIKRKLAEIFFLQQDENKIIFGPKSFRLTS